MNQDSNTRARDRLLAVASALRSPEDDAAVAHGLPPAFAAKLKAALFTDPQIPRASPSHSLWQEPPHPRVGHVQSPELPRETDFVIIGSGITACSVTKALLENENLRTAARPPRVTVLEARGLVSGATGRNGGQLVSPIAHTYSTLVRRFGVDNANDMARFSVINIQRLFELIGSLDEDLQDECEIRALHKTMVAKDEDVWEDARESLRAFREAIPEHVDLHRTLDAKEIFETRNVKGGCGATEHRAGAVWPYRLITGIFDRLLAAYPDALAIETDTPVTDVIHASSSSSGAPSHPYSVVTPRGIIRARQVVHCTNGHAAHLLRPLRGHVYPFRNTMSVQRAGSELENIGADRSWTSLVKTSLDTETGLYREGLFYLQQNARTGDIWVGNECSSLFRAISGDDTTVSAEAMEALLKFLPTYFRDGWPEGEAPQIRAMWTGIQGHSSDGLPLVGRVPASASGRTGDGEWIAGAYNGYGMDKAWMTGQALAHMIAGEGVPDWFPACFLISDERVKADLTLDRAMAKWGSIAKTGDW